MPSMLQFAPPPPPPDGTLFDYRCCLQGSGGLLATGIDEPNTYPIWEALKELDDNTLVYIEMRIVRPPKSTVRCMFWGTSANAEEWGEGPLYFQGD